MAKQRWVPDTAGFANALDEVQSVYLDIVHEETEQALAGHGAVLERMRRLEKSTGATTARIAKLVKTDYTPVASESQQLAQTLAATQVSTAETMLTLQRIDKLLPAPDRLFAPGQPNRRHFPQLHAAATTAAAVPDLVGRSAQPAAPAAQLNCTPASAANASAAKGSSSSSGGSHDVPRG